MEIKTGEASIKTQASSEIDSESEISLETIAKKKKKKETQCSEAMMYFHYYTAILYDKPLSLKQSGTPVQEKGKNHVLRDWKMQQRDLPVAPSIAYRATALAGGPVAVSSTTLQTAVQSGIAPFFEQRGSKVPGITESVTVVDASCTVDVQPLAESVPIVGAVHDIRGQYGEFRSPTNALHSLRNETSPLFSTVTQRERLNALRLGDASDDHTVRISYPFQRWFGEHSVKVSIRRDSLFESAMVLQPSDVRASDALARQLEHWPKQTPHILLPDSAGEERQQDQQQREQEEEQ